MKIQMEIKSNFIGLSLSFIYSVTHSFVNVAAVLFDQVRFKSFAIFHAATINCCTRFPSAKSAFCELCIFFGQLF